ncbi:hypothetical protein ACFOY2_54520 [Nonomuraea purpurea]|uniref:Uncharacterized protein n=1 Tax=Nonomuraea purpurea TaxID=1849276 RepID=A0ABV8GQP0_9ACTN
MPLLPLLVWPELAHATRSPHTAMTWPDAIIGRRSYAVGYMADRLLELNRTLPDREFDKLLTNAAK